MPKRLLVVDDDPLFRNMLVEILEFKGYEIIQARDGEEGIEVFKKEKEIDLVIADIRMPRKNGFQMAKEIHDLDPTMPILFISGWFDASREAEGKDAALTLKNNLSPTLNFLKKPFRITQLVSLIEELTNPKHRAGVA